MSEQKTRTYYPAIDLLRIIAILAVILIHTSSKTLAVSGHDLDRLPWTLYLNQASRFAVPLFFMISGFVLALSYLFYASYFSYLKKRVNRILIPYIFWSAVYYVFVYNNNTKNFFEVLIKGEASYQLYFIPALLLFYLLFPIIHTYYKVITNRWVLIPLGILELGLLYYDYYIHALPAPIYPVRVMIVNYFIFILGVATSHHKDLILSILVKWRLALLILVLGLSVYIFFEGYTIHTLTHQARSFLSQWRLSVFVYTLAIAALVYSLSVKNLEKLSIIKTLGRLSFFVFFIHVIILEAIWLAVGSVLYHQTNGHIAEQIWYDPLFFFTVTFLSFLIAYLAQKIPGLSKITG